MLHGILTIRHMLEIRSERVSEQRLGSIYSLALTLRSTCAPVGWVWIWTQTQDLFKASVCRRACRVTTEHCYLHWSISLSTPAQLKHTRCQSRPYTLTSFLCMLILRIPLHPLNISNAAFCEYNHQTTKCGMKGEPQRALNDHLGLDESVNMFRIE